METLARSKTHHLLLQIFLSHAFSQQTVMAFSHGRHCRSLRAKSKKQKLAIAACFVHNNNGRMV